MAVVLLIPHVLVVFHLPLLIECQCDETIHRFRKVYHARCVFLLHLERKLRVSVGDDLCGQGFRRGHDLRYACIYAQN